jgi:hypothetical protein
MTDTTVTTSAVRGAVAGAAGTTALNALTYLDMLLRARPESSTPTDTVKKVSAAVGVDVPGSGRPREIRASAMGALLGLATGVTVGALYGVARAAGFRPPLPAAALAVASAAMIGSNAPMAALHVTDPRAWSASDWAADVVPHLAFGLVTAGAIAGAEH